MVNNYQYLLVEINENVGTIWLNRPEMHNAFNEGMISEITNAFQILGKYDHLRAIVLRGKGKSFCAGADLNWMRQVSNYNQEENLTESLNLARCFSTIYKCVLPTIAIVHGSAFGGANGLVAACDFAYAEINSVFSFSEVRIGIVPAVISPYVIRRTGEYGARELMLTGKRINGHEAERLRLVNRSLPGDQLEEYLSETLQQLKLSGPMAVKECKSLITKLGKVSFSDDLINDTAAIIARLRASDEGQEGIDAFLNKRKPNWIL